MFSIPAHKQTNPAHFPGQSANPVKSNVPSRLQPSSDVAHVAAQRMRDYGGSFTRNLAEAYFVADRNSQRKLLDAFGDLFERYADAN